jgi:hypothetical protein
MWIRHSRFRGLGSVDAERPRADVATADAEHHAVRAKAARHVVADRGRYDAVELGDARRHEMQGLVWLSDARSRDAVAPAGDSPSRHVRKRVAFASATSPIA